MIEALETLDEYEDVDITVYDEYQAFVRSYEGAYFYTSSKQRS